VWAFLISIGSLWRALSDRGLFPDSFWLGVAFAAAFMIGGLYAARAVERALLNPFIHQRLNETTVA